MTTHRTGPRLKDPAVHRAVIGREWAELGPGVQARFTQIWGVAGETPGVLIEVRGTPGWEPPAREEGGPA